MYTLDVTLAIPYTCLYTTPSYFHSFTSINVFSGTTFTKDPPLLPTTNIDNRSLLFFTKDVTKIYTETMTYDVTAIITNNDKNVPGSSSPSRAYNINPHQFVHHTTTSEYISRKCNVFDFPLGFPNGRPARCNTILIKPKNNANPT